MMTDERFKQLMDNDEILLTKEEAQQGWHFCLEMDGLLRCYGEGFECSCNPMFPTVPKTGKPITPMEIEEKAEDEEPMFPVHNQGNAKE